MLAEFGLLDWFLMAAGLWFVGIAFVCFYFIARGRHVRAPNEKAARSFNNKQFAADQLKAMARAQVRAVPAYTRFNVTDLYVDELLVVIAGAVRPTPAPRSNVLAASEGARGWMSVTGYQALTKGLSGAAAI